jgi:tetratricopeptide (TPR) repeat protein
MVFAEETPQQVLDLQKAAESCLKTKDITGALESYQAIIQAFPGTTHALNAQRQIVTIHIDSKAVSTAEAEIDRMLSTYSGLTEDIDDALNHVIIAYEHNGHYQQVIEHCQYMLSHWPNCSRAMWGLSRQAQSRIMLGGLTEAERLIELLKSGYSDQTFYGNILCVDIAGSYLAKGHSDKALRLWEDIANGTTPYPVSREKLALYAISRNEFATASDSLDQLKQDRSEDYTRVRLFLLAEACANKGGWDIAIDLYEYIISHWSDWDRCPEARKRIAELYLQSGDAVKCDAELERLLSQYGNTENIVGSLEGIKTTYWATGYRARSQALCEEILRRYPDDPRALTIQADLICGALAMDDISTAEAGIEIFFNRYTEPEEAFLYHVARIQDGCLGKNDDSLAIEIGNRALKDKPTHENVVWIHQKLACSYLDLNAKEQADAAINTILEAYPQHPAFAKMMNGAADSYRSNQHYARAVELYQLALARATGKKERLCAYAGMAKSQIQMPEVLTDPNSTVELAVAFTDPNSTVACPDVDTIVQLLTSTFKDENDTGFHVFQIGEEYYFRGEKTLKNREPAKANADFLKAIAIWEKNRSVLDDLEHQAYATYYSGVAYKYMGDTARAIEYYQQVVENHPDYEKAWHAQYMIAKHYEKQAAQGKTSIEQVRQAYQTLLDKYPDSPAAEIANKKLNTL